MPLTLTVTLTFLQYQVQGKGRVQHLTAWNPQIWRNEIAHTEISWKLTEWYRRGNLGIWIWYRAQCHQEERLHWLWWAFIRPIKREKGGFQYGIAKFLILLPNAFRSPMTLGTVQRESLCTFSQDNTSADIPCTLRSLIQWPSLNLSTCFCALLNCSCDRE